MDLTLFTADGLQNVYTPFTPKQHLVFCVIATVIYLLQFYRRGAWHYLVIMLGIDLTYLTQTSLCESPVARGILGAAELIILITALVLSMRFNKQQKLAAAAASAEEEKNEERREQAAKEQEKQDRDIVDNAFDE